jgi:Xaa-Pro aminopeptidase
VDVSVCCAQADASGDQGVTLKPIMETGLVAVSAFAGRLSAIQHWMADEKLDALLVAHAPNVRYLSGHDGTAGLLVVLPESLHLLVDARYRESARQMLEAGRSPAGLTLHDVPDSYDAAVMGLLHAWGIQSVGVEADHLTVSRYQWFEQSGRVSGRKFEWHPVSGAVERGRLIKDEREQAALRRAATGLTEVADAAFRAIRPGVEERFVAGTIEAALRSVGFERPAFDTIVASGSNSALPHYRAGARIIESGDLVVLDFGGVLDGYCSDITRTVSVGPPGSEARRVYGVVLRAQQAAIDAVAPGIFTDQVDSAARTVMAASGLGEAFCHGTGHGLGLEVHELPRVGRPIEGVPGAVLAAGMVLTVEPGAYLPGFGGVRIEDDVLVTPGGCEVLTVVSRELLAL